MLARTHLMLEHRAAVITPLKLQLIGVDLAGLLGGGRMASAEGGSACRVG